MKKRLAKYTSLYNTLKTDILSHKYLPGQALPSEQEFMTRYDVSRTTVRKALGILKEEGLIDVQQGKNTRVSSLSTQDFSNDFISVKSEISLKNNFLIEGPYRTTNQAAVIDLITAPPAAAKSLRIKPESYVYRLQRMKMVNNQIYSFDTSYIPQSMVSGLEQYSGKIYHLYRFFKEHLSIEYERGEESISAKNASFVESRLLNTEPGAALLVQNRLAMCKGVPFEYSESIKRADLLEIIVTSQAITPNAYYDSEKAD